MCVELYVSNHGYGVRLNKGLKSGLACKFNWLEGGVKD